MDRGHKYEPHWVSEDCTDAARRERWRVGTDKIEEERARRERGAKIYKESMQEEGVDTNKINTVGKIFHFILFPLSPFWGSGPEGRIRMGIFSVCPSVHPPVDMSVCTPLGQACKPLG